MLAAEWRSPRPSGRREQERETKSGPTAELSTRDVRVRRKKSRGAGVGKVSSLTLTTRWRPSPPAHLMCADFQKKAFLEGLGKESSLVIKH